LFSKIHKEYDTNKLIQEKNEIQNSFKIYRYITIALIIVFISIVSVIGYKFYSTQKKIKKINSKKIVFAPEENEKIIDLEILNKNFSQDYYEKIPGLKADTVKNILNNLDNFEKNLGFLDAQLTQLSLSEKLETNASYLSKIFKAYKEKNYNVYIGDLRITYIINLLSTDKKNWEKDIKELANLGGFSNAENFSDHFKRKIGSTPSQYIKSLRKEDNF
jgi:AraC-like DNA-binding protein